MFERFVKEVSDRPVIAMEEAEKFYSLGFSLYEAGNAKEASEVFEVLCAQWPLKPKYWFAFASSKQENKEYEKALYAWAMAAILNDEDPYPHFHAAECHLSIDKKGEAQLALAAASLRSKENGELQDKIELLRQQWELKQ